MHASAAVNVLLLMGAATSALPAPAAEKADPTREVLASEDARFTAMARADTAALAELLADDLLYVHSSGRAETKAEYLKAVGSKALQYLAFVPSDRRTTGLGLDAAVVQGRANARVIVEGKEREFDVRYIAVYSRAGSRWQLRAWQTTRVTPPGGG